MEDKIYDQYISKITELQSQIEEEERKLFAFLAQEQNISNFHSSILHYINDMSMDSTIHYAS